MVASRLEGMSTMSECQYNVYKVPCNSTIKYKVTCTGAYRYIRLRPRVDLRVFGFDFVVCEYQSEYT